MEASELWRRWGAPGRERKAEGGVFHEYDGIGFLVRQGEIAAIYGLPRRALMKERFSTAWICPSW